MDPSTAEEGVLHGGDVPHLPAAPAGTPVAGASAGEIYLQNAPLLRRIALGRFHIPPADAENLVHDVFITFLANPQRVRIEVQRYLVAAICNASRHYWRDRHSEWRVFDRDAEVEDAGSIAAAAQEGLATRMLVAAAMARLDRRCRHVLESYYLRGDASPVIARALSTSQTNVNYLMHICRKRAQEIFHSLSGRKTA